MSIMLMTGAAGTVVDYLYGYMVTCSNEAARSQEYYIQQKQQEKEQTKSADDTQR